MLLVVLFMVLREDTINQTMLVPMDLRNLIPEDHPCYFIKNVVDQVDCSQANKKFENNPGESAYPRELLLRIVLMSVFNGGLSSREISRKNKNRPRLYVLSRNAKTCIQNNKQIQKLKTKN